MTDKPRRLKGRPSLGVPMRYTGLYLPVELSDRLRTLGNGNLGAGLRAIVAERDRLEAEVKSARDERDSLSWRLWQCQERLGDREPRAVK